MSGDDFRAAVFQAIYQSPRQRYARAFAIGLLLLKHALRGILFSWPLYLLGLIPLIFPGIAGLWVFLLLVPGITVSATILNKGVREDYDQRVRDQILKPDSFRDLLSLFPKEKPLQ